MPVLIPNVSRVGLALHKALRLRAFSLVEVVLAIAVCSFGVIAILGLLNTGLRASRDSEQQIQASDMASTLISLRTASPTNAIPNLANFAIPTGAMTATFGATTNSGYLMSDGQTNVSSANAVFGYQCMEGTNLANGPWISQVNLMLWWPPGANVTNAAGRYEITTEIPIR